MLAECYRPKTTEATQHFVDEERALKDSYLRLDKGSAKLGRSMADDRRANRNRRRSALCWDARVSFARLRPL